MPSLKLHKAVSLAAILLVYLVTAVYCQSLVYVGNPTDSQESPNQDIPEKNAVPVDKFQPTHEWQTIKDGQSIPKGLHVRMNLETGLKEAKLMDEPGQQLDQNTLEQALKNIATSHDEPHSNKASVEGDGNNKRTFRSLEEITSEFASRKIAISSEQEILEQLLSNLINSIDTSQAIALLTDIEYYLHSVDNANYFTDVGGTELLVNRLSNATDTELVAALCLTIGSAAHTNPYVSDRLADIGAINVLLKQLDLFVSSGNEVTIRRIVFTLSAVSCSSSRGMGSFIDGGGLAYFMLAESGHTIDNLQSSMIEICEEISQLLPHVKQLHYLEKLLHFVKAVTGNKMCYALSKDILHSLQTTESMLTSLSEDESDSVYTTELLDCIKSIRMLISSNPSYREEL